MENISIYADKESKSSVTDNNQKYSSFTYSTHLWTTKNLFGLQDEEELKDESKSSSNTLIQYLLKNYKSHIHYNSSEPEKLGVKAFTKNSEIHLAPGAEDSLDHELAHVYQQKIKNIPTTTKIGKEKVNLDPKFEKEADEIAEHIEDYISEIVSEDSKDTKTKDVIQFDMPNDEELQNKIEEQASKMGMSSELIMEGAIEKTKEYYYSSWEYFKSWFYTSWFKDYLDVCINWALQSIKIENARSAKLFETYPGSVNDGIIESLEDAKYYKDCSDERMLDDNQYKEIINCLKKLSNYCDEKGLTSVLEGANTNVIASYSILKFYKDDDKNSKRKDYFVKRLVLMTEYIENVARKKDFDGQTFGKKYWIRSTGSDPHYKGQHALFLVNKITGNIERVYKPHDLSADNEVVGSKGIFSDLNRLLQKDFKSKLEKLGWAVGKDEKLFATMDIDVEHNTEKFVTRENSMTSKEAQKYFFRAGMLKVITDAMAVIDLHCDNIMPTKQGPIIIDAEIDFFHYGEDSSLVGGNAPALSTDEIGYNRANASFDIEGTDPQTFIQPGNAFSNNIFSCKDKYTEGYNFMLSQLRSHQEKFSNEFYNKLYTLNDNSKIRILPLATQNFAEYLNYVISGSMEINVAENELRDKIKEKLSDKVIRFLDSEKIKVELNNEQLQKALLTTFTDGTIPAMYADMNGNLYLDDEIVGRIVSKIDDGELKVNDQVNKQQMTNIMKNCFVKALETMQPLKAAPEAT